MRKVRVAAGRSPALGPETLMPVSLYSTMASPMPGLVVFCKSWFCGPILKNSSESARRILKLGLRSVRNIPSLPKGLEPARSLPLYSWKTAENPAKSMRWNRCSFVC